MGDYLVYIHTNLLDGKKYIGLTSQPINRRWRNGNGYYLNDHFYRAICRDGWDNFKHEIVKAGLSKKEACELEKELIAKYKTNNEKYGYNKSTGGEYPAQGVKLSAETLAKMSRARKGQKRNESTKRHISEAKKGKSNGLEGRFGRNSQNAGIVRQIDISSGEVVAEYYGYCEMKRKTGFKQSPVKRAVSGQQKKSYGFKWEYIPKGDKQCHC